MKSAAARRWLVQRARAAAVKSAAAVAYQFSLRALCAARIVRARRTAADARLLLGPDGLESFSIESAAGLVLQRAAARPAALSVIAAAPAALDKSAVQSVLQPLGSPLPGRAPDVAALLELAADALSGGGELGAALTACGGALQSVLTAAAVADLRGALGAALRASIAGRGRTAAADAAAAVKAAADALSGGRTVAGELAAADALLLGIALAALTAADADTADADTADGRAAGWVVVAGALHESVEALSGGLFVVKPAEFARFESAIAAAVEAASDLEGEAPDSELRWARMLRADADLQRARGEWADARGKRPRKQSASAAVRLAAIALGAARCLGPDGRAGVDAARALSAAADAGESLSAGNTGRALRGARKALRLSIRARGRRRAPGGGVLLRFPGAPGK